MLTRDQKVNSGRGGGSYIQHSTVDVERCVRRADKGRQRRLCSTGRRSVFKKIDPRRQLGKVRKLCFFLCFDISRRAPDCINLKPQRCVALKRALYNLPFAHSRLYMCFVWLSVLFVNETPDSTVSANVVAHGVCRKSVLRDLT